jgi:inositol-phosphate phosphatase / L-galactose 1-phosphate phosphatase / histidinol-phosphatase
MLAPYAEFAQELAQEAATMLAAHAPGVANTPLGTTIKADKTFVTGLDLAIETRLRERLQARFPEHGIYGEEFGTERLDAEWVWTLDPIDGTMALVAGMPVYSTLIALARHGKPLVGVMNFPATGECWVGVSGQATTCNGRVCRTRSGAAIHDAIQSASNPDFFVAAAEKNTLAALSARTAWRVFGGAALSYGRLAMGRTDIAIDAGLKVYDYAPFVPIIEGAGGKITDWQGRALTLNSGSHVLAAGDAALHQAALAVVQTQWQGADNA